MKKDWESLGYLEGLNPKEKKILIDWLDRTELVTIFNEHAKNTYWVILRLICVLIVRKRNQNSLIKSFPDRFPQKKILAMVKPIDIVREFDNYSEHFIHESRIWLLSLDSHAELSKLFCENYVMSLVNEQDEINKKNI